MVKNEMREQYEKTGNNLAFNSTIFMTSLSYLVFRYRNISIGSYFLIPTMIALVPISFINKELFVNKSEDRKLREMMVKEF